MRQDASFDAGLFLGVLIGEGHFGGDRKQPHITLKMHVRHLPLLEWLRDRVPGARLYGPYAYERRHFYQLMIRGNALRERIVPLLDALPWKEIDTHTYERYHAMKVRYGLQTSMDDAANVVPDADGGVDSDDRTVARGRRTAAPVEPSKLADGRTTETHDGRIA